MAQNHKWIQVIDTKKNMYGYAEYAYLALFDKNICINCARFLSAFDSWKGPDRLRIGTDLVTFLGSQLSDLFEKITVI